MIDREINPNPIAQGRYVPATRTDNMIFTAGMTPRKNGILIKSGKIKLSESLEDYKEAVIQATTNAITAARNVLVEGEELSRVLSFSVYVNAEEGFTSQSKIADFASEFLYEELGQNPNQSYELWPRISPEPHRGLVRLGLSAAPAPDPCPAAEPWIG